MAGRDELIAFLDELLDAREWPDFGPNGLQVPGVGEVGVVVTGVSAHRELFDRAAAAGADLVLCHHGILWDKQPRVLDLQQKGRLEALFAADLSLAAYHLPLDAHPEVGNNALICEALGLERAEPFAEHGGRTIGWVGRCVGDGGGIPLRELVERCGAAFGRAPLVLEGGPETVRRVGVLSGGGASYFAEAAALGVDAFITGEPSEPAMAEARERGVTFLAGGHWATETFGVRRLGELLAERFGVEHRFEAVPNPV